MLAWKDKASNQRKHVELSILEKEFSPGELSKFKFFYKKFDMNLYVTFTLFKPTME